ncbi:substrate-binding domain-containing protein [Marmoricola sp. OAE513]|uniref:substrate-binding domain-containing protein n=1 Tax=Marmoricola sp. OAE513 TaxID=2817894 RepID=UPI003394B1BF
MPVVRADGAGVTNQFTTWLAKEYPSIWKACNGKAAPTDYFPTNCGEDHGPQKAQSGSDGVMNYVKSSNAVGAIAMEEYSYPLMANFPVAKLLNKAGYYTLPTQYNVAVALTAAQINNNPKDPNYLTQKLDRVYVNPDKRTYALSSYVYAIIPTAANDQRLSSTPKRQTLADFLYYSICQGQSEIGPVGYSPLPINLVKAGFEQIAKIKKADSKVDLTKRDVSTCNNPTFIAGKPNVNHLAQIAPQPPACDKIGAEPCAEGVGSSNANPGSTGGAKQGGSGSGAGTGSTGNGASGAAGPNGAGGTPTAGGLVTDPVTGELVPASAQGAAQADAVIVPTTLDAGGSDGASGVLTAVVIGLFAGAVVTPVAVTRAIRRRGGA